MPVALLQQLLVFCWDKTFKMISFIINSLLKISIFVCFIMCINCTMNEYTNIQ